MLNQNLKIILYNYRYKNVILYFRRDIMSNSIVQEETQELKTLTFRVPEDVYWEFKKAMADRRETPSEAGVNAALLYIDSKGEEQDESDA